MERKAWSAKGSVSVECVRSVKCSARCGECSVEQSNMALEYTFFDDLPFEYFLALALIPKRRNPDGRSITRRICGLDPVTCGNGSEWHSHILFFFADSGCIVPGPTITLPL